MRLILEEVLDSGTKIVAELDAHTYRVGRDLTTDIPLSSTALSRQHGMFFPFSSGWLFKDLGSTNGSWQNGTKLESQRLVGLKEGDYLQLADVILKVRYTGSKTADASSRLFVVKDGEPFGELPFSHSGGLIEFGGRHSQFPISGYLEESAAVQFAATGPKVFVEPGPSVLQIRVNNVMIHTPSRLTKGDSVVFGEYEIILFEGSLAKVSSEPKPLPPRVPITPQVDLTAVPSSRIETQPEELQPKVFSPAHTIAIHADKQRILRFGEAAPALDDDDSTWIPQKPQQRVLARFEEKQNFFDFDSMSDIERRLVWGIIFFLGSSLLLFLIWLIFL